MFTEMKRDFSVVNAIYFSYNQEICCVILKITIQRFLTKLLRGHSSRKYTYDGQFI